MHEVNEWMMMMLLKCSVTMTIFGGLISRHLLSDYASVYLYWRCEASVVTTTVLDKQNKMIGG